jgi:hypothetical protein
VSRSLSGRATRIDPVVVVALAFGVMEHGKGKLWLREIEAFDWATS